MTARSKSAIKAFFESSDRPTESQFSDLIDSYADFGSTGTPLYTDIGTNNNVYAITAAGVSAYVSGQNYAVKWANVNTSAATLNVNGIGAVAIKYNDGSSLTGTELPQNGVGLVYHNGTNFVLPNINPSTTGAVTSLTGDVTGAGPGATATTLASTAVSAGTYANPTIIVDAKGRITSATAGSSSSGALIKLASAEASNSATIDFVNGVGGVVFDSTYPEYKVEMTNITVVSGSGADFYFRTTSDGGSTYNSNAGDYSFGIIYVNTSSTSSSSPSGNAATKLLLNANGVFQQASGTMSIFAPAATDRRKSITFQTIYNYSQDLTVVAGVETTIGGGQRTTNSAINGFRFLLSSGNIVSGTIRLYGVT